MYLEIENKYTTLNKGEAIKGSWVLSLRTVKYGTNLLKILHFSGPHKVISQSRTQPGSFQAIDFQLTQLSHMCASERYDSVLGVDATFKCDKDFVTLSSFQHKMFINKSRKHPVFTGPSVIHMTKEFDDYHYLASHLKIHCKIEDLRAFGRDGEINVANAFICELPDAIHLRWKIHLACKKT